MTDAFLFDRPTRLEGPDGMADWIRMFVKRPFDGLEAALSDELIAAAVDELGADSELLRDGVCGMPTTCAGACVPSRWRRLASGRVSAPRGFGA